MFRRFRRAALQPNAFNPVQMQTLRNAIRFVSSGQPGLAAPLFAKLAGEMETTGHPRRAANLKAQAAHAFADSQNELQALNHSRTALNLFIQYQMTNRAPVFFANITRKFLNKGMKTAAETIGNEFGSRVGTMPAVAMPASLTTRQLPTNCPKCGAPIHKIDLYWVDDQTIECDFCASLIRSE
jgi:hypothetical protein